MKKIILLLILSISYIFANMHSIDFKKGWQLVGFADNIEDISLFKDSRIQLVWSFDNKSKKWLSYSSYADINTQLDNAGVETLKQIDSYNAVWIYSVSDWTFVYEEIKTQKIKSNLQLFGGWNLVSISSDLIISDGLFEGMKVLKYSEQEWSDNNSDDLFPSIDNIDTKDGIWVYSAEDKSIDISKISATLRTFSDELELKEYIIDMHKANQYQYHYYMPELLIMPMMDDSVNMVFEEKAEADREASVESAKSVDNATDTNIQEVGVDESDILKHNGKYIFNIDSHSSKILIRSFDNILDSNLTLLTEISFTPNTTPSSMYIKDDKLIVLLNYNNYNIEPYYIKSIAPYYDVSKFVIEIYDISDILDIKRVKEFYIDGYIKNSRLVGNSLYMISSFSPSFDDYENPSIDNSTILPTLLVDGTQSTLINPNFTYAPHKLNQSPTITSITQIDINSMIVTKNISIIGDTDVIYASTDSIYLTNNQYPSFFGFTESYDRTTIYKFNIKDDFRYEANGQVGGMVLNQFSMSEYDNHLRIATTTNFWGWRETDNALYVLKQESTSLVSEGEIHSLGEDNEVIKSARFMGDRGFLVTAIQTDPFYTLDLSDHTNPIAVGELKVAGFSTYLHPIDNNLILSLGRDDDAFKIELYDISNFANPISVDKAIFTNSSSNAEYNHKAFTFRSSDNLFSFGLNSYFDNGMSRDGFVYQIEDSKIVFKNQVTMDDTYGYNLRSIIFDDSNKSTHTVFIDNNESKIVSLDNNQSILD